MKYLKKIINILSNKTDGMSDNEYMQRYNYTQALNFPESCINYNPMGINTNKNNLSPCIGIDMDKVYYASALACKAVTYTGKYHILSLVNNKYYIYIMMAMKICMGVISRNLPLYIFQILK